MLDELVDLYVMLRATTGGEGASSISIVMRTPGERDSLRQALLAEIDERGGFPADPPNPLNLLTINDCHIYLKVRGVVD